ncbi:MAG TPA: type II toxin-antitoxin system VapC family toxin [Polyangiaceae bacterium]
MRIVLDASVAIAAQRPTEPAYAASRARLVRFLTGQDTVLVPSFFIVEVSGALARLGFGSKTIVRFVERLTSAPHEVVTVGPRSARAARSIAVRGKLRGPDALYVWLGGREGAPVCTLDREILARGVRFCQVMGP